MRKHKKHTGSSAPRIKKDGTLAAKYDETKHVRGPGGKFGEKPGGQAPKAVKQSGSVAQAHAIFDKMKGKPKAEVLAAAKAAGLNPNTAKTQLYHWQKKEAAAALGSGTGHTKADLQAAAAKALGIKAAAPAPAPPSKPATTPVAAPGGAPGGAPDIAKLGPTKYVHALADYMPGAAKKDVLAAAVKAGVNPSTAGVQYGKWAKAKAGEPPQLKTSPEPAALKAKDPAKMTDREIDRAIASYQGKVKVKPPAGQKNWAKANGVHDSNSKSVTTEVESAYKKAKLKYDGETEGVTSYTGDGYEEINGVLRDLKGSFTGKPRDQYDHATKWTNDIDKSMSTSRFAEDTIMWRGVGHGGTVWNGAPPPLQVQDHGFTSVSFRPDVAKNFSNNKVVFKVLVPKGFPGLSIAMGQPKGGGVAGLQDEAEVLLPRGTTYKVVQREAGGTRPNYGGESMDVVTIEPVLPEWFIKAYGTPKVD